MNTKPEPKWVPELEELTDGGACICQDRNEVWSLHYYCKDPVGGGYRGLTGMTREHLLVVAKKLGVEWFFDGHEPTETKTPIDEALANV